MPVDHSKHGFLKDIGSDWVALAANGAPLARAATEEGVRRAVPNADRYVTGVEPDPAPAESVAEKPEPVAEKPEPVAAAEPVKEEPVKEEPKTAADPFDHDGDGKPGGSEKGENATASKSRRKRKPAE